jgi:hypothetical protein
MRLPFPLLLLLLELASVVVALCFFFSPSITCVQLPREFLLGPTAKLIYKADRSKLLVDGAWSRGPQGKGSLTALYSACAPPRLHQAMQATGPVSMLYPSYYHATISYFTLSHQHLLDLVTLAVWSADTTMLKEKNVWPTNLGHVFGSSRHNPRGLESNLINQIPSPLFRAERSIS